MAWTRRFPVLYEFRYILEQRDRNLRLRRPSRRIRLVSMSGRRGRLDRRPLGRLRFLAAKRTFGDREGAGNFNPDVLARLQAAADGVVAEVLSQRDAVAASADVFDEYSSGHDNSVAGGAGTGERTGAIPPWRSWRR